MASLSGVGRLGFRGLLSLRRRPGVELLSNPRGIIYADQPRDQVQHERVAYLLTHKLFIVSNIYCIVARKRMSEHIKMQIKLTKETISTPNRTGQ